MPSQAILVDSACAPSPELLSRPHVYQMGMKIKLDDRLYTDGEDLDLEHFYSRIDKVSDFSTTPPLVWDIKKNYEELKRKGYTSIISIHVSAKMSKLLETCDNARDMVGGVDIRLIDSQNLSIGANLIAERIVELIESGIGVDQVISLLPEIRQSAYMQISLSTLKYLVKNKRIGRVQGLFGAMLKVRPILGLDSDGYLTTLTTERGGNRVVERIAENALTFLEKRPYNQKICMTWGYDDNHHQVGRVLETFSRGSIRERRRRLSVSKSRMWPTLACNCGPEAYGFAVYGEERPLG